MPEWGQLGLQDASSPFIEEFIFFHDFTMVLLTFILAFVGIGITQIRQNPWINTSLLEGQAVECVWTLLPALVLIQIAVPSLLLLYILDENESSALTLKAIGHQWYWRYEFSDFWQGGENLRLDSFINQDLRSRPRLLEVDNRVSLPCHAHVRVLVSSGDVLHAWALPALGVKVDACPGRLNQVAFLCYRPGLWVGQCSEICGANHRFIPVVVETVKTKAFLEWVTANA